MMANDEFEQFLEREAASYNAPPSPPADVMWARIEREVAVQRGSAGQVSRRWQRGTAWIWSGAIAAALVIGVLLGRFTLGRTGSATSVARTVAPAPDRAAPLAGSEPRRVAAAPPDRTRRAPSGSGTVSPGPQQESNAADPLRRSELPYRVAALQHLVATEALLTSVQASRRAGLRDSAVALWARDLLGTTRMLIDSPASEDPQMQRLLEDLELVLVQIAHLQPNTTQRDIDLIEQAIRQHDVMTRLRTATPSAPLRSRT